MPYLTDMSLIGRTIGRDGHDGRTDGRTDNLGHKFAKIQIERKKKIRYEFLLA
jgi:hypothetical protein